MIWFKKNPEVLQIVREQIRDNFPTMQVVIDQEIVFIRGSLYLYEQQSGKEFDRFGIEIILPDNFPNTVPKVRETEDRIPKIIERHYMSDGFACLYFRDEQYKFYTPKTSIIDFIKIPVYNFFLSQSYFELTGKWIFGARAHNQFATWEYYTEILGTDDIDVIGRFLWFLASKKVKINDYCYCGSNKNLSDCHLNLLLEKRKQISVQNAHQSFKDMLEIKEKLKLAIKWAKKM